MMRNKSSNDAVQKKMMRRKKKTMRIKSSIDAQQI